MTTFADFRAQVRRDLEEPTANVWSDASLMWYTNETAREVASRVRQNEEETYTATVAGEADYELPADTQEITAVRYNGVKLLRVNPESVGESLADSGAPSSYQRMDEVLRLYPTPDAVGTLLILRKAYPTDITDDTADMPFRSERNTVLEYGVLSRAFEQVGDWQSADAYKQRFEAALAVFDADASIAEDADGASSYPVETY